MDRDGTTRHVLIADDDLAFQVLIEQAIRDAGLDVTCVDDGVQALSSVMDRPPDLIFLDNLMPEMTGQETCIQLRNKLGDACPPIVMVTGCDGEQEIADAFAAGALDYLVKPVNWSLFHHRLSGWLTAQDRGSTPVVRSDQSRYEFVVSRKGEILEAIRSGELRQQISEARLLGDIIPDPAASQIYALIRRVLRTRDSRSFESDVKIGDRFATWNFQLDIRGREKVGITIRPFDNQQKNRSHLFRLAYTESSTGLPNRHLFALTVKDRLAKARFQRRELAVLCLAFAEVGERESQNSKVRDLLVDVVASIDTQLREDGRATQLDLPDSKPLCISSLDGRQFLVLVENCALDQAVPEIVSLAADACEQRKAKSQLSLRAGFAKFPEDGDSAELLIESAHAAAHASVRNDVFYTRADEHLAERLKHDHGDVEAELLDAIEKDLLRMYYQPRVDLQSGRLIAVEALVRWPHPLLGEISGGALFARLGGGDAIRRLADWALVTAVNQAASWQEQGHTFKVSVNLSAEQVIREDFADKIAYLIGDAQVRPETIELEATEAMLDCNRCATSQFSELINAGIGLVIDDFGSGKVSLTALRRLSVSGFKIDHRGSRLETPDDDESGVFAIGRAVASGCNATMIAKGIESSDDLVLARERGCDQAQGLHICQPLPAAKLQDYIAELALSQTSSLDVATAI